MAFLDYDYTLQKDFVPGRYKGTNLYINAFGVVLTQREWEEYSLERREQWRTLAIQARDRYHESGPRPMTRALDAIASKIRIN